MPDRGERGNRGPRKSTGKSRGGHPSSHGHRPGGGPKGAGAPKRRGGLGLARLGGHDFELVHPRCVREMELDYEEGIELRKAGDPEAARDALRYALQGCGDNLWVHVALGWIALEDFKDPSLARGHFGYGFELAQRALPPGFSGRLPRHRLANRPFYDAIEGLSACYEALGKPDEAASLKKLAARMSGATGPGGRGGTASSGDGPDPPNP
jgi:hypothetical protein